MDYWEGQSSWQCGARTHSPRLNRFHSVVWIDFEIKGGPSMLPKSQVLLPVKVFTLVLSGAAPGLRAGWAFPPVHTIPHRAGSYQIAQGL